MIRNPDVKTNTAEQILNIENNIKDKIQRKQNIM